MQKVLLVRVRSSDAVRDATQHLLGREVEWVIEETVPATGFIFSGKVEEFDAVVFDYRAPGTTPTAEYFIQTLKSRELQIPCVVVGPDEAACKLLLDAGCEVWCDLMQLPACIRSYLIISKREHPVS